MLVDLHCHLDDKQFTDIDAVIARAKAAKVVSAISAGTNPASNRAVLDLAAKYDLVKPALGIYPIDGVAKHLDASWREKMTPFSVDDELTFIESQKPIAISEVGLDYHWVKDKKEEMKEVFSKVIAMTERMKLPIIVHTRKAELDCIDMLESSSIKHVILHCFGGNFKLVRRAVDLGWKFTVSTSITRSEHFQKMVREVPLRQLFTETDAPYLAPNREDRNEPAKIRDILPMMAELKQMDVRELEAALYMNYQRVFL